MPASVILDFGFTSGTTPVTRVFAPGNIAGGVLGTSAGMAEIADAGARLTGRFSATYTDLPAGDYLMIIYVGSVGVGFEYYTVGNASGRYLPWREQKPQQVATQLADSIVADSLSDSAVNKIAQAVLTSMNATPPKINPLSLTGYVTKVRKAASVVYRQISDELPLNFSWSYATDTWDGSEFEIMRSIAGGDTTPITGAVTAVGVDAAGKYRFSIAYDGADYPEGVGQVDFVVSAADDITVVFRVMVIDTAGMILGQTPSGYGDNTVAGHIRDIQRVDRVYRSRQIAKSADNKSADVLITEV